MNDFIIPDWPAPPSVAAISTSRNGGVSQGPWQSLNLGCNSGDNPADVAENRQRLNQVLPAPPRWLQQVHGNAVVVHEGEATLAHGQVQSDAQWSREKAAVCAVLSADCLPVLFCNRQGTRVAAAHAGWRGLAAGVLENTVTAMAVPASELMAWMGPAIGPLVYQVGDDVRSAFLQQEAEGAGAFVADGDRWLFDICAMARHRLQRAGVGHISGGGYCTYSEPGRFFSYRRDRVTGRMASLVWLV